jgi:WhiB family transcriptional regulator, redox-sensing transcriptional regulator
MSTLTDGALDRLDLVGSLLALVDPDPSLDWQDRGLCRQLDPEMFFPEKGGSTREAKRACASCEVRAECLRYALDNDERFGVWGGLSDRERRRIKRSRGAGTVALPLAS